jgi:hypothetical protein
VPAQSTPAPFAFSAGEIDLSYNPAAQQVGIVGGHDFPDELVSRRSAKSVIAALKLEIRIANASEQQPDQRETFWALRPADISSVNATVFKMNGKH